MIKFEMSQQQKWTKLFAAKRKLSCLEPSAFKRYLVVLPPAGARLPDLELEARDPAEALDRPLQEVSVVRGALAVRLEVCRAGLACSGRKKKSQLVEVLFTPYSLPLPGT